ncbi:hypothetical protein HYN49_06265 [Flavobacterium pallidum]|uniref:Uncharacterized protein n=1 Tax=Flavobacterium pallidum TaxID=2172098 RepID=A0A2S1SGK0_9FLAO|nr:hypothetical protein HYN49_06265 [Flavobacterium pallidum]
MHRHDTNQRIQKSLKGRFLLFIGILFFLAYLILGLLIIFAKKIPFNLPDNYRIFLGIILIVYAFLRFIRLLQKK